MIAMDFLEHLAQKGLIKDADSAAIMKEAAEKYAGDLDKTLIARGIQETDLTTEKAAFYTMPVRAIDPKKISFDILKYIPEDSARHYHFVPIGITDNVLEIGITDPANIDATDALQFITSKIGMPYKYFLISDTDFEAVLAMYKNLTGEVESAISDIDTEIGDVDTKDVVIESANPQDKLKPGEEEKIVEEAPIIKIVAVIIRHAVEGNASDIHIENTGEKVKVRFRVDGVLHTSLVLPENVYAGIVARIKILSKLRLDEKRKPQDGGFSTKIDNRKIDFRVSTFPAYYGEKVVMRILDSEKGVKKLDDLNLSPENLAMVRRAIAKPYGLILITGPTGSGKSTTLYSMLNELDSEKANIVSLEDPVEYHMPNINQSQVMPEIGYTFASGLRSILRQDPNIIMVGEIRDKETAQLAIQAALTGHLVLSTLHTNSAVGVIPRLVDMGVDPYLIAPTLVIAIAQRLAPIVCPDAKKEMPIDETTRAMIDKEFSDLPEEYRKTLSIGEKMYSVTPTAECPLGTRGRMAVFEMFEIDKAIQKIILTNPVEQEIYKAVRAKGMLTMKEDALLKALKGDISMQEVFGL